jgi:hypothetical protein
VARQQLEEPQRDDGRPFMREHAGAVRGHEREQLTGVEQQRHEQAPNSAVAVELRVNGLEPGAPPRTIGAAGSGCPPPFQTVEGGDRVEHPSGDAATTRARP